MREVDWVLDLLDEIESDFSVFHRVDDMYALSASTFFARFRMLSAYGGAFARSLASEAAAQLHTQGATSSPQRAVDGDTPPDVVAAMQRQALERMYADHPSILAGGIEVVSDEQFRREAGI